MRKKLEMIELGMIMLIIMNCEAKLVVQQPKGLINEFAKKNQTEIKYIVASYGHIPWGRSLIGEVVLSQPEDGCSNISSVQSVQIKETPFLMMKIGECFHVTKSKNAEAAGAKLAIISDPLPIENQTLDDYGMGGRISIPTIKIGKEDADVIENFIKTHNSSNSTENIVVLSLTFQLITTTHVNYSFWLSAQNRLSYKLLKDFHTYFNKFGDLATFTPRFYFFTSWWAQYFNFTMEAPSHCISGGRYCNPDPDG